MTRKFKAYDTKAKEWINPEQVLIDGTGRVFRAVDNVYAPAVNIEICHSTGLIDCQGSEVYFGDVLINVVDERLLRWIVTFESGCFGVKNISSEDYLHEFYPLTSIYYFNNRKIIGSNPELLTTKAATA